MTTLANPHELDTNRLLKEVKVLENKLRTKVIFKQIKLWTDLLSYLPPNINISSLELQKYLDLPLTVINYNEFFSKLKVKIQEAEQSLEPPVKDSITLSGEEEELKIDFQHPLIASDQKARCIKFQLRAATDLYYNLYEKDLRGQLLTAGTGLGKTFMAGQLIRWSKDNQYDYLTAKSCSLYFSMLITAAQVVEQTQRVFRDLFGLEEYDCLVTSYDALRSSFGRSNFIKKEVKIDNGVEYDVFRWANRLTPPLILADEIQKAKNKQSTQSRIIQSLADVPDIKVVGMSATPFMTVEEAKAMVLNFHLPYDY